MDKIAQHTETAQEALRAFLTTLLGTDAPLEIHAPGSTDFDSVNMQSKAYIVLTAGQSTADRFAVMLDPKWLPLLSQSMLGEPIEIGEPGADDLLRELASQGYGSLRTQLASVKVSLPEISFELHPRGTELDGDRFAEQLVVVPFELTVEGDTLGGVAVLPQPHDVDDGSLIDPDVAAAESASQRPRAGGQTVDVAPAAFPDLGNEHIGDTATNGSFSMLAEVELEVTVELGRRKIPLADVLRLTTGSVIELDKLVGEPLEVYANGRLIAEGEAVVIDEQFGIRITNLVANRQRAKAFV